MSGAGSERRARECDRESELGFNEEEDCEAGLAVS